MIEKIFTNGKRKELQLHIKRFAEEIGGFIFDVIIEEQNDSDDDDDDDDDEMKKCLKFTSFPNKYNYNNMFNKF